MVRFSLKFLFVVLLLKDSAGHSQPQWTLMEVREGISLYESAERCDTLRNFMATFTVPASIKTCVNMLYDTKFHTDFMDGMKSSEVIKYHNERSLVFYQVIDLPWPIPNRDLVTLATFDHTPDFKTVTVNLVSASGEMEPTYMTRVQVPEREWSFSKNGLESTYVTYRYHTNPSHFPSLLEETFTIDGPLKMMSRFKELASKESRTPVELAWIKE